MYDIIIVGSHLSGLIMALLLKKTGFNVILLEKSAESYLLQKNSRTITLSLGSCEKIEKAGVNLAELSHGSIKKINIYDQRKKKLAVFDSNAIDQEEMGRLYKVQDLLKLLLRTCKEYGAHFNFEAKISEMRQNENSATITLKDGLKLEGRVLLGADGARSQVAQSFGFEYDFYNYNQIALMFDLVHTSPHLNTASEIFHANGPFAALPTYEAYCSSIVWTMPSTFYHYLNQGDIKEKIRTYLPHYLPDCLGSDGLISSEILIYPLHLQTSKLFFKGNVALIGNSLHNLHPVAGQSFNLAVRNMEALAEEISNCYLFDNFVSVKKYLEAWNKKVRKDSLFMKHFTNLAANLSTQNFSLLNIFTLNAIKSLDWLTFFKKKIVLKAMGKH